MFPFNCEARTGIVAIRQRTSLAADSAGDNQQMENPVEQIQFVLKLQSRYSMAKV
jgi:hypothetical protein